MRAGSVFISYTRDDLVAARALRDALDAAHIDVWLDENELQGGSAWEHEIVQNISNCSLFVPLLSHATSSQHRRESFFRHEWNQAAYRVRGMAESMAFILPVVIDDSSVEASHPPEVFLKRQWTSAPGGKPGAEFVQRIVGLYKDYQVMKKGGGV